MLVVLLVNTMTDEHVKSWKMLQADSVGRVRLKLIVPDQVRTLSQVGTSSCMAYAKYELCDICVDLHVNYMTGGFTP